MDDLFFMLQISATIATGYVGSLYSGHIKNLINRPSVKPYKDMLGFRSGNIMNEDNFCRLAGGLAGMYIGGQAWPVALPLSLIFVEKAWQDRK